MEEEASVAKESKLVPIYICAFPGTCTHTSTDRNSKVCMRERSRYIREFLLHICIVCPNIYWNISCMSVYVKCKYTFKVNSLRV